MGLARPKPLLDAAVCLGEPPLQRDLRNAEQLGNTLERHQAVRAAVDGLSAGQLALLLMEIGIAPELAVNSYSTNEPTYLVATAERYGVDPDSAKKTLRAEAREKTKRKAQKVDKAGAKKTNTKGKPDQVGTAELTSNPAPAAKKPPTRAKKATSATQVDEQTEHHVATASEKAAKPPKKPTKRASKVTTSPWEADGATNGAEEAKTAAHPKATRSRAGKKAAASDSKAAEAPPQRNTDEPPSAAYATDHWPYPNPLPAGN